MTIKACVQYLFQTKVSTYKILKNASYLAKQSSFRPRDTQIFVLPASPLFPLLIIAEFTEVN